MELTHEHWIQIYFYEQFFCNTWLFATLPPNSNPRCLFKQTGSVFDHFFFTHIDSTWWICNRIYLHCPQKRGSQPAVWEIKWWRLYNFHNCRIIKLAPVSPCLSSLEETKTGHNTLGTVLQVPNRGERIISLGLLATLLFTQPRVEMAFFAALCSTASRSTCCPPHPSDPFLQSCTPDSCPPACTIAWSYSSQREDFAFASADCFLKRWPHLFFKFSVGTHMETWFPWLIIYTYHSLCH